MRRLIKRGCWMMSEGQRDEFQVDVKVVVTLRN
jgi:hypothetical protein